MTKNLVTNTRSSTLVELPEEHVVSKADTSEERLRRRGEHDRIREMKSPEEIEAKFINH